MTAPTLRAICVAVVLGTTIVNVAIDVLGRDLGVPLSTVQWTITGYTSRCP
ncbi:hypothetical protein [Streptosporangium saharense]|uniref:hypothetical protein n=1 Tax=Streptosporangium saharense TaxID=1706840 RepID=UPI00369A14D1